MILFSLTGDAAELSLSSGHSLLDYFQVFFKGVERYFEVSKVLSSCVVLSTFFVLKIFFCHSLRLEVEVRASNFKWLNFTFFVKIIASSGLH